MSDKPIKLVIDEQYLQTKLEQSVPSPVRSIANADLDKVSAGVTGGNVGGVDPPGLNWKQRSWPGGAFIQIMTHRNTDRDVRPASKRSVTEIYHALAESAAGDE
jgi:hypothetical protein